MAAGITLKMLVIFLVFTICYSIILASKNTNCATCMTMMDEVAQARTESIKAMILKKLGLNSPPTILRSPKTKSALEKLGRYMEDEMRNNFTDANKDNGKAKDETIVFGQEEPIRVNGQRVIAFRISKDLKTKEVVSGVLKVQLMRPKLTDSIIPLESTITEIQANDEHVQIAHYKRYIPVPEHETISLEKKDLERWIAAGFVTMVVEIKYGNEQLVEYPSAADPYTVFLEIVTVNPKSRQKREANEGVCDASKKIKACCRYDLVIDFHKAGWDFVHFPPTYNAFVCLGKCERRNMNGYELLTANVNKTTSGCCHPGSYDDLEVAYFTNEGTLKRTKIPDMIAKTCVCE